MIKKILKILIVVAVIAIASFGVFWVIRPADISFEELQASVPFSEYSHFISVDGIRIHYQEKGSGPPLVLIHGFTSSTYSWKDVFEPLSRHFRVIAVDLKGFGFSGKPDGDYTRRAQATLLSHFLDNLAIDSAWLCGHSMGGEIALNLALQNPNRVKGLILIDTAGMKVEGGGSLAPAYVRIPVIGRVLTALALTSDKLVREGMNKSFYDKTKITEDRVLYYYRPLKTKGGQLAALRARQQAELFPLGDNVKNIDVPVLILWGANDALIPLAAGQKLNALISTSKLVTIAHCGHVPQEEAPQEVAKELTGFIEHEEGRKSAMDLH